MLGSASNGQLGKKNQSGDDSNNSSLVKAGTFFKYVKTKDNTKDLVCHMIAILGMLMLEFHASLIARVIKRELNDMKSYFKELGFSYDSFKNEKEEDDLKVKIPAILGLKHAVKQLEEAEVEPVEGGRKRRRSE